MSTEKLRQRLDEVLSPAPRHWLDAALAQIAADSTRCAVHSAGAARRCGRGPLDERWTIDEGVRALLLAAVPRRERAAVAEDVYTRGDTAERRAVLKALPLLSLPEPHSGITIVEDALRTNDATLIAAALGPFAAERLPLGAIRQAVLKCAFLSVPFDSIPEVMALADEELVALLADYARERILAGRDVDPQILDVIAAHPRPAAGLGDFARDLMDHEDEHARFRAEAARRAARRLTGATVTSGGPAHPGSSAAEKD